MGVKSMSMMTARRMSPVWLALGIPLAVFASVIANGAGMGAGIAGVCFTLHAWAFIMAYRFPNATRWLLRSAAGILIIVVYAQAIVTQGRPWNPNIMANVLLLTVPFGYPAGLPWWTMALFALGFTGSRSAWLAVPLTVFTMFNWSDGRSKVRGVWWLVVVAVIGALGVSLFLPRPATVLNVRLVEYTAVAHRFWQYPVFGSGPWSHMVDSLPLTVAAEGGVAGLLAWSLLTVAIVQRVLTTRNNPARLAMLLWLFHQLFDYTVWDIPSTMAASAVLALLFIPLEKHEETIPVA